MTTGGYDDYDVHSTENEPDWDLAPMLRGTYGTVVAEAIGQDDPALLELVEELMRTTRTALDYLDGTAFKAAAEEALAEAYEMKASGDLEFYCRVMGLAIPEALS